MRVLVVKISSMGDIIHTLPALTDAQRAIPDIQFDWVVEPNFAEIPLWHAAVNRVIPAPLRRWRQHPWEALKNGAWNSFVRDLRTDQYDAVIDAQGLLKTAWITRCAKGNRVGLDYESAREKWASFAYQQKIKVVFQQHAVVRARQLFSGALGYTLPQLPPDYGIQRDRLPLISYGENTVVFLHGTTWATKHWPEAYWCALARKVASAGFRILLPWGNASEHTRAKAIAAHCSDLVNTPMPEVLPKLNLGELTRLLSQAAGIVAVDTGLGHMSAALAAPTLSLYGPTDPDLTGAYGPWQEHLRATRACSPCLSRDCSQGADFQIMPPCFETIPPEKVWQILSRLIHQYAQSRVEHHANNPTVV